MDHKIPTGADDAQKSIGTTGHVWDGIEELNTPLPRWWLWTFYACILWAFGYWIVYPAIPLMTSFTKGTFGWSSREAVVADLPVGERRRHL
jgi:cytochrome c oxidase cbb3-type subunit 3